MSYLIKLAGAATLCFATMLGIAACGSSSGGSVKEGGTATVSWDGRSNKGASVHSGTYVARMTAKSSAGTVSLTSKFSVRRSSGGTSRSKGTG